MTTQPLPLAAHKRLHTRDVDEARIRVGDVLCRHDLRLPNRDSRLDAQLCGQGFDQVGLYSITYGAEVAISLDTWENAFLVEIPLVGAAEISDGRERFTANPELASVLSPTERLTMHWAAGIAQLITRFDRAALESHLGNMLGQQVRAPLTFSLGMDLTQPASRSWLSVVNLLRREVESNGAMLTQPLAVRQLEGLLMTQLLLAQPSNYTPALLGEQPRVPPPTVKRAMDLIEAHAAEPLTVEDIAEAVGVGARALQDGFRRHLETTPMAYLRDVRLERVRAELIAGAPGSTTITDVAFRWGFVHLGRFSRAYRQRFGETPSETLRR